MTPLTRPHAHAIEHTTPTDTDAMLADVEPELGYIDAMEYIFSTGGGVQSTACLVLAAQGKIPYRTFVFANVGDKAESPATLTSAA